MSRMIDLDRKARLEAIRRAAAQQMWDEEIKQLRAVDVPLKPSTIRESRLQYAFTEDGSIGSVKLRVNRDPSCCAFAHFDAEDMDRLAPYILYGFPRQKFLQPYISSPVFSKDYWSLPRMLLEVDDPTYRVRYLNGNCLDNRRCNLATYKVGQFPPPTYYGASWRTARIKARVRSHGICEVCRNQPAIDVHHCIPVRFFERPADAHFLPNLLDLCEECHRVEHLKIPLHMPLFYGLTLPAGQNFVKPALNMREPALPVGTLVPSGGR